MPSQQSYCFGHYLDEDGEVQHCLGPFEHWGEHSKDWPQSEPRRVKPVPEPEDTQVSGRIRELTESVVGGAPVEIGKRYWHPEDGLIEITSGQYWGTHGLSNFWYWTVVETGETHCGYGGEWERDFPCAQGCKPSEGNVCGGPRCT
jgi:hypothetical protein